jgi:hypothetical protein
MVPQSRGIKVKEGESAAELLAASVRKTDEGVIDGLICPTAITGLRVEFPISQ